METIIFFMALGTTIFLILTIVEFMIGFNQIMNLADQPILDRTKLPSISIIFSALNEEHDIEQALTSLLQLDYPNLEIIAINDRSTDSTPHILNRMQQQYPHLRVYHIHELPEGWFGKNHALYFGSKQATGEWLLFTDADVMMKKDILLKTMSYTLTHHVDHLTIYENHRINTFWLKVFLAGQYVTYSMALKPWRIRYSWSKRSLGNGTFNLVNRSVYDQCGGHKAIALECLDDLKLGEIIKRHGFHQDTVDGRDYIEREWYKSLADIIHGLQKNSFAYYNYQVAPLIRDMIFASLFYLWPIFAIFIFSGWIEGLNLANIVLTLLMSTYVAKQFRLPKRYAVFYPVAICILVYTIWNSVSSIYKNKGVIWRGTFYSLQSIKNKKIPDALN